MLKVLMIGPSRNTKGGMSTVINNYYKYGLSDKNSNVRNVNK